MNAIVVVDKKWGIGKNNDLLFKPVSYTHLTLPTILRV